MSVCTREMKEEKQYHYEILMKNIFNISSKIFPKLLFIYCLFLAGRPLAMRFRMFSTGSAGISTWDYLPWPEAVLPVCGDWFCVRHDCCSRSRGRTGGASVLWCSRRGYRSFWQCVLLGTKHVLCGTRRPSHTRLSAPLKPSTCFHFWLFLCFTPITKTM